MCDKSTPFSSLEARKRGHEDAIAELCQGGMEDGERVREDLDISDG